MVVHAKNNPTPKPCFRLPIGSRPLYRSNFGGRPLPKSRTSKLTSCSSQYVCSSMPLSVSVASAALFNMLMIEWVNVRSAIS